MELRLTVPEEQDDRFIVEFPGYISDKKGVKALGTFGGLEGLRKQRKDHSKFLKLKLRPEDGFCHALHSDDVKKSNTLLLQIDRSSLTGGQRAQGRVVRAGSLYRFFTPADIQLGSSARGSEPSSSVQNREEEGVELKCGPPVFQLESPLEFMVDVYGSHGNSRPGQDLSSHHGGDLWLDYMTILVPQDSTCSNSDVEKERAQPFMDELRSKLQKLFVERPVYLEAPLFARLEQDGILDRDKSGEKIRMELRKMCYKFRTGPWRYAWIRNGYDPRKVHNSVAWQVITVASSSSEYDETTLLGNANTDLVRNYVSLCSLKGPPIKLPVCVQLLDIETKIERVREGIRQTASQPLDDPDDSLGWFSQSAWDSTKSEVASMLAKSVGAQLEISMGVSCKQGPSSHVEQRNEDSKLAKRKQPDKDTGHTIVGSDGNIKQLFELIPQSYSSAIAASLGVPKSSKPQNPK